jgi:hypothetical protein
MTRLRRLALAVAVATLLVLTISSVAFAGITFRALE